MARILLAEDDPSQRALVVTILEVHGHTVVEVENGRQAIERLKKGSFDAILLDVMMPEMSGYDVLDELAQRESFSTPIIMVTAQNDPPGIAREARTGAIEHVAKPYSVEELESTLERVLAWSPEERARRALMLRERASTFDAVAQLRETLEESDEGKKRRR